MKLDTAVITTENAAALIEVGAAALRAGETTIDLASVMQVDSAAVALLLRWRREAKAIGKSVTFVNVPAALCSLATLYGMEEVLGIPPAAKGGALTAVHSGEHASGD